MAERVTLRKRNPYNTKSARRQVIKTPGGHLRYLHVQKRGTVPKCGDCHSDLSGIKAHRPREYATLSKRQKSVSRAYGGSRCSSCVRTRYVPSYSFFPQLGRVATLARAHARMVPKLTSLLV